MQRRVAAAALFIVKPGKAKDEIVLNLRCSAIRDQGSFVRMKKKRRLSILTKSAESSSSRSSLSSNSHVIFSPALTLDTLSK